MILEKSYVHPFLLDLEEDIQMSKIGGEDGAQTDRDHLAC